MSDQPNRRRHERLPVSTPAALVLAAGSLEGETVNASLHGLLIRAKGRISVVVKLNGREYRGRLVRAEPMVDGGTYYALDLDDPVHVD
ncbi:MAG: PilZ domain-containing protein [Planctomycetota bacterium]|nr:PilZ domain-containing protein [Planctomycetota bacterium]